MKTETIHYISPEWNTKFIIAKTECNIEWDKVNDFTQNIEIITCKKCLKKITNK